MTDIFKFIVREIYCLLRYIVKDEINMKYVTAKAVQLPESLMDIWSHTRVLKHRSIKIGVSLILLAWCKAMCTFLSFLGDLPLSFPGYHTEIFFFFFFFFSGAPGRGRRSVQWPGDKYLTEPKCNGPARQRLRRVHQYAKIAQESNLAPKRSPPNGAPEQPECKDCYKVTGPTM